jgi:hypothetical protein
MKNLENYLDCQPVNDMNIDNGKIKGNIILNENYNIKSCANPNYNNYEANILTEKDYTNQELHSSTAINAYAILYALVIGLIFTLFFVNVVINMNVFSSYKKLIVGLITFLVTISIIYITCIYFLTSNYTRDIAKIDQENSIQKTKKNKINS